jgi:hypothetical protein
VGSSFVSGFAIILGETAAAACLGDVDPSAFKSKLSSLWEKDGIEAGVVAMDVDFGVVESTRKDKKCLRVVPRATLSSSIGSETVTASSFLRRPAFFGVAVGVAAKSQRITSAVPCEVSGLNPVAIPPFELP